jgi:MYXO-CTERM domain-containing protein
VCDTDNKCGFVNGDGPCTPGTPASVCRSNVCDPDGKCGYANGDGPCTGATGPVVCRSGACSVSGVCEPAGGCEVDGDCTAGHWCMESTHTCTPTLPNGTPIPSDPPHLNPTVNGTCTTGAGALVCTSGVCDTKDNACGYANGDGPCTPATGPTVCRSGACSTNGTCEPDGGCNVDADCANGKWCNETSHMCSPQLPNGMAVPSDPAHMNPTLDGTCTTASGTLTCQSGVCDTKDSECGYANGDGPCDGGNGGTVCRSTICNTTSMTCVACVMDSQCSGSTPICDTSTNTCVGCTSNTQCSGTKPICHKASETCVPCTGDLGSGTTDPCYDNGNPFCFLSGSNMGSCGKCTTNDQCAGHTGMNVCDTTTGLCTSGCVLDSDCTMGEWCNESKHTCTMKVANGMPVPSDSAHTNPTLDGTCTPAAAMLTCQSGVCDTDNACGLKEGDGPCQNSEQCRNDDCDPQSTKCMPAVKCHTDADCKSSEFCDMSQGCLPKLPDGSTCSASDQCVNGDCDHSVCTSIIGSGNGLVCAAHPAGSSGGEGAAGLLGLALAAAGVRRRRR